MKLVKATDDTYSGTGTLALVKYFDVSDVDIISIALRNDGPGALSAFELRARPTMQDTRAAITIKNSNYTTPDANVVSCSLDPTTLASGSSTIVDVDVSYRAQLHIYANVPVGTTLYVTSGQYKYTGN